MIYEVSEIQKKLSKCSGSLNQANSNSRCYLLQRHLSFQLESNQNLMKSRYLLLREYGELRTFDRHLIAHHLFQACFFSALKYRFKHVTFAMQTRRFVNTFYFPGTFVKSMNWWRHPNVAVVFKCSQMKKPSISGIV